MARKKIFNDPVYGFIEVPYGIIFDLVDHPYFQRLRRIRQLGLTNLVYPGANHNRFQHALGAYYLMTKAVRVLKGKGVNITEAEEEAVGIAILLHDIGHGPQSHALEHSIVNFSHEDLSLLFMERLNEEFSGKLSLAMEIFKDAYAKKFLHQLVSGQLDMDRMDYLNRDSYFTGVIEGRVGYGRIIKMLDVRDNELVIEEKGIYSIEQFLAARRIMYWQVYLHKTALSAELMLIQAFKRAKMLAQKGEKFQISLALSSLLEEDVDLAKARKNPKWLDLFAKLDDCDIQMAIKTFAEHKDLVLNYLTIGLQNRKLFRLEYKKSSFPKKYTDQIKIKLPQFIEGLTKENSELLIFHGIQTNISYNPLKEINILFKDNSVSPLSEFADYELGTRQIKKYYICYPKIKP